MRLWEKGGDVDQLVHDFTVGDDPEIDLRWAWHDVLGSIAHVRVQEAAGLLDATEAGVLVQGLRAILGEVEQGRFSIPRAQEDVHTAVESLLTASIGESAGKLHTGRSRNDQVLSDLRMWTKEQLFLARAEWVGLIAALVDWARNNQAPLTGYTHLQRAMPSSYAQWAAGYASALTDSLPLWEAAWTLADRCPLGSAAGYGSPLPLDRALAARLLGFARVEEPATACQLTRGLVEGASLGALGAATGLLARFAWDVTLFASAEFALITLPDALTTGSSIMPQKRNPDVAELLRASAARVRAARREIEDIVALPGGYHRDLQLTKAPYVRGVETARACLRVARRLVEGMVATPKPLDPLLFATAEALRRPEPFREAYRAVAGEIAGGRTDFAVAPAPVVVLPAIPGPGPGDPRVAWRGLA